MENDLLTYFPRIEVAVEVLIILLCGGLAGGLSYQLYRRWKAKLWPHAPKSSKTILLRLLNAISFPAIAVVMLSGAFMLLRKTGYSQDLIEGLIPFMGFLMIYQVLSVGIEAVLPKLQFTRFMVRMALAIGVLLLALRSFGWYERGMFLINYPLLILGPVSLSMAVLLKSAFIIWALFLAAALITGFLQHRIMVKTAMDPSLSFAMMRFLKFFLFGIGVLIVLDTAGVNLSTLTIFGGALGIGVGFGLQNIANNFLSGMILLLDRSIKQGDVITVGESYGWVVRLGARYIVVRTRDGVEKLIPNANLIASEITNWSHTDRAVRLHIKVGVSYDSDPFRVRELLLKVASNNSRVLKKPDPNVLFMDFGESSLNFELRIWIMDPEEGIESVRSAIRFEVWKILKENDIQIPYPQRDIHIKSEPRLLQNQEVPSAEDEESFPPVPKSEKRKD